ncbi:hypothetical protein [Vibrio chagasii]|uniref:hypothetical protein n=1 Tax=Vibrio chagasii TaxID=170679 RepID=UPI0022837BBB|nr:hypothetical protein [Vibrio chagasii]MCY9827739.1 hypothetical protein [Vibrio chagasii]
MSYDIVYEQLALRVPESIVTEQLRQFFTERLGINTDELSEHQRRQRLYEHCQCLLRSDDLIMFHMLIGCSNLFDPDTNKRCRDWQFCGIDTPYNLLIQYGCDWSAQAQSGGLKLNGRDTKAEGWIRAVRQTLDQARDYRVMPHCHRLSVWLRAPREANERDAYEVLTAHLRDLNAVWQDRARGDEEGFDVSITPSSAFEMWLFQQLVTRYQGKCWLNGSAPPYHAVKKHAI